MSWQILLMMLLLGVPSISYADSFTNCVEEVMRSTGKPRDEATWACNQVLSKPTGEPRKLPRTYEEKIARKEDILNWGRKYNVPLDEVKKVMELYGVYNIPEPEKVSNVNTGGSVNMPEKNNTTSSKEAQKEKANIPGSDGEAWIEYPDGTRKRIY